MAWSDKQSILILPLRGFQEQNYTDMILAFWILLFFSNQFWNFPKGLEIIWTDYYCHRYFGEKAHSLLAISTDFVKPKHYEKEPTYINSKCQQQKTPEALLVSLTSEAVVKSLLACFTVFLNNTLACPLPHFITGSEFAVKCRAVTPLGDMSFL